MVKIFLSWSGEPSKSVANIFKEQMKNEYDFSKASGNELFISTEISKGKNTFDELFKQLDEYDKCLLFLTKNNFETPWISFEAGCRGAKKDNCIFPILIDLTVKDLNKTLSPFRFFNPTQMTNYDENGKIDEKEISKLFKDLLGVTLKPNDMKSFIRSISVALKASDTQYDYGMTATCIPFYYIKQKNYVTVFLHFNKKRYSKPTPQLMFSGGHVFKPELDHDERYKDPCETAIRKAREEISLMVVSIKSTRKGMDLDGECGGDYKISAPGSTKYIEFTQPDMVYFFDQDKKIECYNKGHAHHLDMIYVCDVKRTVSSQRSNKMSISLPVGDLSKAEMNYFVDAALDSWNRLRSGEGEKIGEYTREMLYAAHKIYCEYAVNEYSAKKYNQEGLSKSIRLKVTGKCNLSCTFCHEEGNMNIDEMIFCDDLNNAISTLSNAFHINNLSITGGEPLHHSDLVGFMKEIKAVFQSHTFSITTNGTIEKDKDFWRELHDCGLTKINISINEDTMKKHLDAQIRTLKTIEEVNAQLEGDGMSIGINTIVPGLHSPKFADVVNRLIENGYVNNISLLPDLTDKVTYEDSEDRIYSYVNDRGYVLSTENRRPGTSSVIRTYENTSGHKIYIKSTKPNGHDPMFLNNMCNDCKHKSECQEGYYGFRLEQSEGKIFVRTCLYKEGYKPIECKDFQKSLLFDEIKKSIGSG
jgi:molybdenum cofactor biosynthesis enzyme MoaA